MFLILRKTWMNFFNGPRFGESCWNYHMIAVHSRTVYFAIKGKKMAKWSQVILPFLPLFCHWFGHYFALVGIIDTTSLARECSCILYPNNEIFCPNNGQFFSFGDATAYIFRLFRHVRQYLVDCRAPGDVVLSPPGYTSV